MTPLPVLSLGAGVQSTTLALMAARRDIEPMPECAVFADTGAEPSAVYDHLDWLERELPYPVYRVTAGDIVADLEGAATETNKFVSAPFFTASPDPKHPTAMLPRQCTHQYKIKPVADELRKLTGTNGRPARGVVYASLWLGISTDEIQRLKVPRVKWYEHRWPLIEQRMSRGDCMAWLEQRQYPIPPKSACTFCPYHNDQTWSDMKANDTEAWHRVVHIDRLINQGLGQTNGPAFLHRSLQPIDTVDFDAPADRGQLSFLDECDGVCGL